MPLPATVRWCIGDRELSQQLEGLAKFFGEDPKHFKPKQALHIIGTTATECVSLPIMHLREKRHACISSAPCIG
eukprot:COSAG01_NODE_11178_length_1989_cov_1.797354_5_plen_73_part_01